MFLSLRREFMLRLKHTCIPGRMRVFSALLVLLAAAMWSGTALANCAAESPINITVDSGATYTIDLTADHGDCAPAGIIMSDPVPTAHGTVTHNNATPGTPNFDVQIYYANNGDGATSDTFTFNDGGGYIVTVNVTINLPPITVTPSSVPDATVGVTYTPVSFTASGGATPYTYSISAGSLPAGMNLSSNGALSGTPTEAGPFNFTVEAKDANNFVGSTSSISMTVNTPTITVSPSPGALPNLQVGVPCSQQFSASGGTQGSGYAFAISGTVPAGLSLSSSGLLSGTPTSATSSASFTITATDQSTGTGAPFSGQQSYTVSVIAPTLSMSPASGTSLTAATQGSSYSQQFTASGGTHPYTYQVTGGTLPNGLSLAAGGQLSGTPTQAGTFNFTVTAYDSSTGTGSPFSVAGSYTLNVQAIVPVANPVSDTVSYGSSSNVVSISFSGGTPTSVAIASPASHGTATASGTTITYTPISGYTGTDSFTYTGTNAAGTSATPATVSITISGPTLAITSSSGGTSLTATVGQSFTQTFTFSGGKAPYHGYSITGIPAGLSVTGFNNTSITISGTPTVSGTFTLKVSGTDSSTGTDPGSGKNAPFTVNQSFTLQINAASMGLSPASGGLPNAAVGTSYNQVITASGGVAPYTYTVTSGSPPSGVILTTAGILGGTPSTSGTFNFTVTATDSSTGAGSPASASASYTLSVDPPAIALSPSTLPDPQQGTAYSQQLIASGGTPPYTYAVTSGSLPAGLSLSPGGSISGTPTASGPYNFTLTATDSSGGGGPYAGSETYTLNVLGNPPTAVNDSATTGWQQDVNIPVTNNDSGNIGSIAISQNPANGTATVNGLTIDYSPTGTFSGSDSFAYTATGPGGTSMPAMVTVSVAQPIITLSPASLPQPRLGSAYDQMLTANGGTAPYTCTISGGALPTGLLLSNDCRITGTPTTNGRSTFTITVTDSSQGTGGPYSASQEYSVSVAIVAAAAVPLLGPWALITLILGLLTVAVLMRRTAGCKRRWPAWVEGKFGKGAIGRVGIWRLPANSGH